MKLRILGCGTSSGVPRIGNDWGRCDPTEPKNRRLRSSLIVESAGARLLIDCGPDVRQQLLAAEVARLDMVIFTHDHADHSHGLDDLRQLMQLMGEPIAFRGRSGTLNALAERFRYAFIGTALYPPFLAASALDEEERLGSARLRFVDQPHGPITSVGIRVDEGARSAVYAIDFHDLTEDMADLYEGSDLWISDCLRRRPHPSHAHLDAVLGWARDLRVGQLVLSHLDNSMDMAELARELPDWAAPGFDGQEFTLA